jgi:hypothetical protein
MIRCRAVIFCYLLLFLKKVIIWFCNKTCWCSKSSLRCMLLLLLHLDLLHLWPDHYSDVLYLFHLQCMFSWEISRPNLFLFEFFTFFCLNFVGWHICIWCHVGINLSVASYDYLIPSHLVFLNDKVRKVSLISENLCVLFYFLITPSGLFF